MIQDGVQEKNVDFNSPCFGGTQVQWKKHITKKVMKYSMCNCSKHPKIELKFLFIERKGQFSITKVKYNFRNHLEIK